MKLTTPKHGCYVCLEGIQHGNRFMTLWKEGDDPTKSFKGEMWYRVLGYADTHADAMEILYPVPGSADKALQDYMVETMLKIAGVFPMGD